MHAAFLSTLLAVLLVARIAPFFSLPLAFSRLRTDLSFPTIAGEGKNGAIIHYSAEPVSCGIVGQQSMLLLDSGTSTICVHVYR